MNDEIDVHGSLTSVILSDTRISTGVFHTDTHTDKQTDIDRDKQTLKKFFFGIFLLIMVHYGVLYISGRRRGTQTSRGPG